MANTDRIKGKFVAWETGCQRKDGEEITAYYERAKEYNRRKTKGTFTVAGDKGGMTVVGVTIGTYEAYLKGKGMYKSRGGCVARLADLSFDEWNDVLASRFVGPWKADRIVNRSVMELCVDFGWLCGVSTAIKKVQGALGCTADGVVGDKTLAKLNGLPAENVHARIKRAYMNHIEAIVKANPSQRKFRNGWMNRIGSYVFEG